MLLIVDTPNRELSVELIDDNKVILRKRVHNKIYKIEKKLETNNILYLKNLIANVLKLPDEFWLI